MKAVPARGLTEKRRSSLQDVGANLVSWLASESNLRGSQSFHQRRASESNLKQSEFFQRQSCSRHDWGCNVRAASHSVSYPVDSRASTTPAGRSPVRHRTSCGTSRPVQDLMFDFQSTCNSPSPVQSLVQNFQTSSRSFTTRKSTAGKESPHAPLCGIGIGAPTSQQRVEFSRNSCDRNRSPGSSTTAAELSGTAYTSKPTHDSMFAINLPQGSTSNLEPAVSRSGPREMNKPSLQATAHPISSPNPAHLQIPSPTNRLNVTSANRLNVVSRASSASSCGSTYSSRCKSPKFCEALILGELCLDGDVSGHYSASVFAKEAEDHGYRGLTRGYEFDDTGCVEFLFPGLHARNLDRVWILLAKEGSSRQEDVANACVAVGLLVLKQYELQSGAIAFCIEGRGARKFLSSLHRKHSDGVLATLTSSGLLEIPSCRSGVPQELKTCIPEGVITSQTTLAIVLPESMRHLALIRHYVADMGFAILRHEILELTKDEAQLFKGSYPSLRYPWNPWDSDEEAAESDNMICVLALRRDEAVSCWLQVLGPADADSAREKSPRSLRAHLSQKPVASRPRGIGAGVHGSATLDDAASDIQALFPEQGHEDCSHFEELPPNSREALLLHLKSMVAG